jgi:hypothetical protein
MTSWRDDPRLPFAIAAVLGMIAGVAAKQAVAIQTGHYPRPIYIFADFLVLGIVWLIAMYTHKLWPDVALEGIALLSAALAMWGPKGIAILLKRFTTTAASAAEAVARSYIPVEPVHRPTDEGGIERERVEAMDSEDTSAKKAPIRKLRDVIPLEKELPGNMAAPLFKMDKPGQTEEGGQND